MAPPVLSRLRPAKVRSGVRRRWFEHRIPRIPAHPTAPMREVGTPYGAWLIPDQLVDEHWTCWCAGAGRDVSFDQALLDRGAAVRVVEPVQEFADLATRTLAAYPRAQVFAAALATEDGPIRMGLHHEPDSGSLSSAGLYESPAFVEVPGRSLASLLAETGDDHVDLLKLDLEGAEYGLVPQLDLRALGVRVFCIQLHHVGSVGAARALIAGVEAQGYVLAGHSGIVKLTFARG